MTVNKKIISIFDLDGTLTKSDTYLPYLLGFLKRNPKRWPKALILPFAVVMFYLKMRGNEWLKTIFLSVVFKGETKEVIDLWNKKYIDKLFNDGLHLNILEILKERQKAGHIIMLSTASLDIYVPEICERFDIEHLICTNAKWVEGRLSGGLNGPNCYGPEKLNKVKQYLSEHDISGEIHMFSDHSSDWPIMEFADKAYAVYPTAKMRALAKKEDIEIIET